MVKSLLGLKGLTKDCKFQIRFKKCGVPHLSFSCIWNVLLMSTISLYLAKFSDT